MSIFGKFESKEKAIKALNYIPKVFVVIGVINIFAVLIFESKLYTIAAGSIYVILGFLLMKYKNILIPVCLLLLSIVGVVLAILNGYLHIIGIALAIASVQAIKAIKYIEKK